MKTKHTPGPWRVEARNYPIADTGDYNGDPICNPRDIQRELDARLPKQKEAE